MSTLGLVGVTFRRARRTVLDDVTLTLPPGSITALLGPNGSGKTTLMSVAAGLLRLDQGTVTLNGHMLHDPHHWRQQIVFVPTGGCFLERESARAHFEFGRRAYPRWSQDQANEAAHALHVPLDRPLATLSTGQRMGAALAYAFATGADVLLLDEPANGLDPEHRQLTWHALALFAAEGTTLLVSSHVLPEIEGLADRGVFLREGRVVQAADLDDLRAASTTWQVILPDLLLGGALDQLRGLPGVHRVDLDGRTLHVHVSGDDTGLAHAIAALRPLDVQRRARPLAETYAALMERSA